MKTYIIDELDKIFEGDTYPYVSLHSSTHKVMVHYNNNTMSTKDGWKRVKKRLESGGLADGFYIVKAKSSPAKNVKPDEFYIKIGEVSEKDLVIPQLSEKPKEVEKVLTYDAAIASNKKIADLSAEIRQIQMELEQKNKCIVELEEDIKEYEEEFEELSEVGNVNQGKEYIEELVAVAIPILDRYFDLEQRKVALKEKMINGQGNGQHIPPASTYQSPEVQQEQQSQRPIPTQKESKEFLDKMDILLESDPEEYQKIMRESFEQVTNG